MLYRIFNLNEEKVKVLLISFKEIKKIESIYTGGTVRVNSNFLFTTQEQKIKKTALEAKNQGVDDYEDLEFSSEISCFDIHGDFIVVALKNLQILIYLKAELQKTLRLHDAPTLCMDSWKGYVASGSADSTVKVIDIKRGFCTHSFKGHSGVISCVAFSPEGLLASGSDDCSVRVWNLYSKRLVLYS